MADQKAILNLQGSESTRALRVVLKDSDGGDCTFTDYGAATQIPLDQDYVIAGIQGQGTTAPATATAFQFRVNGIDKPDFINGAAVYDPTSSQADRLGSALGKVVGRGSMLAIKGRA